MEPETPAALCGGIPPAPGKWTCIQPGCTFATMCDNVKCACYDLHIGHRKKELGLVINESNMPTQPVIYHQLKFDKKEVSMKDLPPI